MEIQSVKAVSIIPLLRHSRQRSVLFESSMNEQKRLQNNTIHNVSNKTDFCKKNKQIKHLFLCVCVCVCLYFCFVFVCFLVLLEMYVVRQLDTHTLTQTRIRTRYFVCTFLVVFDNFCFRFFL